MLHTIIRNCVRCHFSLMLDVSEKFSFYFCVKEGKKFTSFCLSFSRELSTRVLACLAIRKKLNERCWNHYRLSFVRLWQRLRSRSFSQIFSVKLNSFLIWDSMRCQTQFKHFAINLSWVVAELDEWTEEEEAKRKKLTKFKFNSRFPHWDRERFESKYLLEM